MNTIMIDEKDVCKIVEYKAAHYFENFVFDEFRISRKTKDYKIIYKITINENTNKITFRMIEDGDFRDCKFIFTDNEEGYEIVEAPSGDLVNRYIENMLNQYGETKTNSDITDFIMTWVRAEIEFIRRLKQYIMNESYRRTTIQKESSYIGDSENEQTEKAVRIRKPVVNYLLGDIVEYVSRSYRKHNITCECWGVRGHFRHYKSGKVTWISGYEKGKRRNAGKCIRNNIYTI